MSSLKLATIHFQRRFNNSIDYHTINGVGFKILCRKYLLLEPVVISTYIWQETSNIQYH